MLHVTIVDPMILNASTMIRLLHDQNCHAGHARSNSNFGERAIGVGIGISIDKTNGNSTPIPIPTPMTQSPHN